MTNALLAWKNKIDQATLSGGSWQATLPLSNLQDRRLGIPARSVDATNASTKFNVTLPNGSFTKVIGIVNHNFSFSSQYRFRASSETSTPNNFPWSQVLSNWQTPSGGAVNDNVHSAPDGTNTLGSFVEDTSTGVHQTSQSITLAANSTNTVSILVYAAGRSQIQLAFQSAYSSLGTISAIFDLSTQTVVSTTNGGVGQIVSLGGGLYRVGLTGISNTGITSANVFFRPCSGGNNNYTGNGAVSLYLGFAMAEPGTAMTSYYPNNTGGVVTRPTGYIDNWQSYQYNSGINDVWPTVYPEGTVDWNSPSFWNGKYSSDDLNGYQPNLFVVLPSVLSYQYWLLEFFDTTNSAGYVQIGRVFMGNAWQTVTNIEYGADVGWQTTTEVQTSLSGAEYFNERNPYRVAHCTMKWMTEDEAMTNPFEIMRQMGISREVVYLMNPADGVHALRKQFLGRLEVLNPIFYPYLNANSVAVQIKELLP